MATSKGKGFEARFRQDVATYLPDCFCYRLNDQISGYHGSSRNIADFICYKNPLLYVIDCKSHKGSSISFKDFSQYERMIPYKDIPGVVLGTVIWFYEKDIVCWVSLNTWEKLASEGKKSFSIKCLDSEDYPECFTLTSRKLRTYMETDYSSLTDYYEEKMNAEG